MIVACLNRLQVRQLHESLGGCDAPVGVAVVALDEDRLYEAGGKHAR